MARLDGKDLATNDPAIKIIVYDVAARATCATTSWPTWSLGPRYPRPVRLGQPRLGRQPDGHRPRKTSTPAGK